MKAEKNAQVPLEKRVETMDMELKEYFTEFRSFVTAGFVGLETRLTERIENLDQGLSAQIGDVDRRLSKQIEDVDQRLSKRIDDLDERLSKRIDALDERLSTGIEDLGQGLSKRIDGLDAKVDALQDEFSQMHAKFDVLVWRQAVKERRRTKPDKRAIRSRRKK